MHETAGGDPIRVAIVGYGLAGAVFHAPLVAATAGMEVAAVVTRDPARAAAVAADHPAAEVLDGAERVWERAGQLNLVVVAAPNREHVPLAQAAIAAGLAVVVDKPLATSAEEARSLMAAAERAGVLLTVFHNRRWDNDFLTLRKLLADGALGTPLRLESRFERHRPEVDATRWRESGATADGGGLLLDLGSHLIDQAMVLFGRPTHVYAELERRRPGAAADDDSFVALRFGDGPVAHLWMSALARRPGPRLRLTGTAGAFERFGLDPQEAALRAGLRPTDPGWGEEPEESWGTLSADRDGQRVDGPVAPEPGAYECFYALLGQALRGAGPPPVDPADGVAVLEVIDAARRSAEGRAVVTP